MSFQEQADFLRWMRAAEDLGWLWQRAINLQSSVVSGASVYIQSRRMRKELHAACGREEIFREVLFRAWGKPREGLGPWTGGTHDG